MKFSQNKYIKMKHIYNTIHIIGMFTVMEQIKIFHLVKF